MSEQTQLRIAHDSPALWRVAFDNPPINLLDPDTIRELHQLVATIEAAEALKVVVFESANPDYFIAHYDISRASETPPYWADFTMRLAHAPVVSIAAVRGRARGVGKSSHWRAICASRVLNAHSSASRRLRSASFPAGAPSNGFRRFWVVPERWRCCSAATISMPRRQSATVW